MKPYETTVEMTHISSDAIGRELG